MGSEAEAREQAQNDGQGECNRGAATGGFEALARGLEGEKEQVKRDGEEKAVRDKEASSERGRMVNEPSEMEWIEEGTAEKDEEEEDGLGGDGEGCSHDGLCSG